MSELLSIYKTLKSKKWVNLSHKIDEKSPKFPALPALEKETLFTLKDGFYVQKFSVVGQYGTHIDAPIHFVEGGRWLDEIELKDLLLPLYVIDKSAEVATNNDYEITKQDILDFEKKYGEIIPESFVAFRSDWSKRWPNYDEIRNLDENEVQHTPGWSREALEFLIKERKVENIELFYDLIFVYAISKISGIIHHPHHGVIEPWTFFNFVLASLVVLQEWLYMTNYLNRFGTFNFREIVTMCVNMTAAIYLSNSFLADWSQAYYPFTISMLIMALSVAFLYHCQALKKGFGEKEAVNARNILLIVSSLLIVSLFVNFYIGTILLIITNFSGVFLPVIIFLKKK